MSGAPRLAALAVALTCVACAPQLVKPELSLVSVTLEHGDLLQQHLKVRLRVRNPNERALPVRSIEYAVRAAQEELAHGASEASFTVPAHGEAEFDMSVSANLTAVLVRLIGHGADTLDFTLIGKVSLAQGWLRTVPFEEHGSLKLH